MQRHGWILLFHDCLIQQLRTLHSAAERACRKSPEPASSDANVKLFGALSQLMMEAIPSDPSRSEYRQGNTSGPACRHWRRAKIGRRFRLFFRYDSTARVIIFSWVNDAKTLRNSGSGNDPYAVFGRMPASGNPPDDWPALMRASRQDWQDSDWIFRVRPPHPSAAAAIDQSWSSAQVSASSSAWVITRSMAPSCLSGG